METGMLQLASNKKSAYTIVIRKEHTPSEQYAAEELQKYFLKSTGAELKIATDDTAVSEKEIAVGFTNRAAEDTALAEELGDEGYVLKTDGNKLLILGSGVRGALYGVYTFLEKYLGCRFYTFNFEKIPTHETLEIPEMNIKDIPAFEYRDVYWFSVDGEDIKAKLKINGSLENNLTARVGGGVFYTGGFCHTIGHLAEMPCGSDGLVWDQPCFSDEKVYQTVLKNVKKIIEENPDTKIISISQNDGNSGECSCEKCRAVFEEEHSHMGTMLRFVNRIQEEIKKDYPGVHIDTLAYRFSRHAPDVTVPHEDVIIRLCNIEACFRHPLNDCNSPDWGGQGQFSKDLEKWSKICNHLYIWDYTTNFTNFSTAFANFEVLRPNVRFFVDNGVKGVFEQGNIAALNGEFGELRGYLLAKLLWNPRMSEEEYQTLMNEFIADYYGEAGKYVRAYLDLMHDCSKESHFGVYFDDSSKYIYVPGYDDPLEGAFEFIRRGNELWDKAEAAAKNDFELANVQRSRIQLYNYIYFVLRKQSDRVPESEKAAIEEKIIANNKKQFELMKKYEVWYNREFHSIENVENPDFSRAALCWE